MSFPIEALLYLFSIFFGLSFGCFFSAVLSKKRKNLCVSIAIVFLTISIALAAALVILSGDINIITGIFLQKKTIIIVLFALFVVTGAFLKYALLPLIAIYTGFFILNQNIIHTKCSPLSKNLTFTVQKDQKLAVSLVTLPDILLIPSERTFVLKSDAQISGFYETWLFSKKEELDLSIPEEMFFPAVISVKLNKKNGQISASIKKEL